MAGNKLLVLLLILGVLMSFVACTPEDPGDNPDDPDAHTCVDEDGDEACDECGEGVPVTPDDSEEPDGPGPDEGPGAPDAPELPDDGDETGGNVNDDGSFDLPGDTFD